MSQAALLALLEQWPGARWLQQSGTAYLLVNASHIFGIALLIGSIVPLDVLLLRRRVDVLRFVAPLAIRSAASGLVLALITGAWLFTVQPQEYFDNAAFRIKLFLLAVALLNVLVQHRFLRRAGAWQFAREIPGAVRACALASMALWVGTLLAGRWIGFV